MRAHNLHMHDLKVSWFSHIRKPTSKFCDRVKFLTRIKPIQSTCNWIGWFFFYMKKISYWLKLISYQSYHNLRPYGFEWACTSSTYEKESYLSKINYDQASFFWSSLTISRFSKRPHCTKWERMKRSTRCNSRLRHPRAWTIATFQQVSFNFSISGCSSSIMPRKW